MNLIRGRRYEEARKKLIPIVGAYPDLGRPHFLLGLTFHKERRYEKAKPYFARALAIEPRDHAVRPFFGWCLYYLGEAEAAKAMFASFLKVKPGYADAHYALGLIAFDADRIASAAERFHDAIKFAKAGKQPEIEGKSRVRLADLFVRQGDLVRARDELNAAITLMPDAYGAYFKLSRVLQRLGDAEGAEKAREMSRKIQEAKKRGSKQSGGRPNRKGGRPSDPR